MHRFGIKPTRCSNEYVFDIGSDPRSIVKKVVEILSATSESRRWEASTTRRRLEAWRGLKSLCYRICQRVPATHKQPLQSVTYVVLLGSQAVVQIQLQMPQSAHPLNEYQGNSRGPPGGPPLPPNPGGPPPGKPPGGNPGNPPGGAGPPTPTAGPLRPTGSPRPAGLLIPGPAASVGGAPPAPPGVLVPSLADGSAGGGPSTEQETICVPRTMVRPKVRFSSDSTRAGVVAPGAAEAPLVGLRLTRRNSSVSAKTRFMC